jgi:chromosome partitioning protein
MAAHDCVRQAKAAMEDLRAKSATMEEELRTIKTESLPLSPPEDSSSENWESGVSEGANGAEAAGNMKVVSVINYKGGVGKTTLTSNIAAHVASLGKRVLMIDLDPQTNLTLSFMGNEEWANKSAADRTLKNFFEPLLDTAGNATPLDALVIPLDVEGVKMDLISSHLELINVDTELAARLGRGSEGILRRNFLTVHSRLSDGMKTLGDRYDLVLIDCPPSFNTVVKNALTASDFYLIPAKMDYLSTLGIDQLDRNSQRYVEKYNEIVEEFGGSRGKISPKILGVVPTMVTLYGEKPINVNQQYLDQVKSKGFYLFPWLRENSNVYAPAPSTGIPVIFRRSGSPALPGIVEEIKNLSEEFMAKVGI